MAQVTPTRDEIPVEHTWDTDSIFASVSDWEAAIEDVTARFGQLSSFKGRLHEGAEVLLDYFKQTEAMYRILSKVFRNAIKSKMETNHVLIALLVLG